MGKGPHGGFPYATHYQFSWHIYAFLKVFGVLRTFLQKGSKPPEAGPPFPYKPQFSSKTLPALAILSTPAPVAQLVGTSPRSQHLHDIVYRSLGDVGQRLLGQKRLVGGHDDVGHGDESGQGIVLQDVPRIVLKEEIRLLLVHVQTGRAYLAGFDPRQKRLGIHQSTAGGVEQHHTLLALVQSGLVDDVVGLLGQRAVQRDDVTPHEQLLQLHVADGVPVVQAWGGELIVAQNLHAKAAADVDEHPPDAPRADDTHGLAVEIEARHVGEGEVEVTGADVGLVDAADGGEEQSHGMLGHGVGGVGGDTQNVDLPEGVLHVHVVEARAAQGDELDPQLAEAVNDGGVDGIVDEHADPVVARGQLYRVLAQLGLKIFDLYPLLTAEAIKGGLVVVFCVEKCDLHMVSFLWEISNLGLSGR